MKIASSKFVRIWFWAGVLLTAVKLWLTRGQPVFAIGTAAHDDRLFLEMAESISKGEWLGAYSQMTLAKGPFYSIWIAALYWIGVPLGLGVQMAYAAACAVFARACRPAVPSGPVRFALYAFLLWNPMSFEGPTLCRIIRQQIYTPLALVVFAGLVALYCRRQENLRRQWPWAALLGLAFGCFWLTREESVWLVPSVVLLAAAALFWAFRGSRVQGLTMLQALGLAAGCAALPVVLVCTENYRHYGWFGTVEFRAPEFNDAYGAMVRVKLDPVLPLVPVTRQAREAMYAVSPAFATLRPWLDGDIGTQWAEKEMYPVEDRQIRGGWLMWALRDCVVAAGHGHSAREALDFYQLMADEINRACDEGRLAAHPRRSGFLPIWKDGETADVLRTTWMFADFVAGYKSFTVYPPLSIGTDDEVSLFRDLTRDRLTIVENATNYILPNQIALDNWKLDVLQNVGKSLRQYLLVLFLVAHPLIVIRLIQIFWTRQLTFPLVLAAAAWGGSLAYLLINALVQVTSFSVVAVATFWPVYPLLQVFTFAAFWDAAAWFGHKAGSTTDEINRPA